MKKKLTEDDIRKLRYQCRPGFIIAFLIFFMSLLISFTLNISGEYKNTFIITGAVLLAVIIAYYMTNKYIKDIRNNEKEIITKIISAKEFKIDYEAGSGTIDGNMKAFGNYSLIIDNYKYSVEKDFFESCKEGDKVIFHIALISRHRVKMELAENTEEQNRFYDTKF